MEPFRQVQRVSTGGVGTRTRGSEHGLVQQIRSPPVLWRTRPQLGCHAHEFDTHERIQFCRQNISFVQTVQGRYTVGRPVSAQYFISFLSR